MLIDKQPLLRSDLKRPEKQPVTGAQAVRARAVLLTGSWWLGQEWAVYVC
jgi:hypothetical protein